MTVDEHLLFYARLKGISPEEETKAVAQAMKDVQLLNECSTLVSELPLGMRRRLSIAICIVSNPSIIFLDEPTTGLDPDTRRQLWNILKDCKNDNRAMVLTTHSMEEADILCTRIGIVNNGVLSCIGSQNRLKSQYGGGYHLFINCHRERTDTVEMQAQRHTRIKKLLERLIPKALMLRCFNGQYVYQVPTEGLHAERLFHEMEESKASLGISDWGISQCSLEDVFTRICELRS